MDGARSIVLDEDGDLADLVPHAQLQTARQASLAGIMELPSGWWDARIDADRARDGYGLLVLDGVLVRRVGFGGALGRARPVGFGGRFGAELLAEGDLLRPWESDGDETIGFETTWRVLASSRMAILDTLWTERMAPYTAAGAALGGRAAGAPARASGRRWRAGRSAAPGASRR